MNAFVKRACRGHLRFRLVATISVISCFLGLAVSAQAGTDGVLSVSLNSQIPLSPVALGQPVTYTITVENVGAPLTAAVGVRVYMDSALQPADAGEFSSNGCLVDSAFPSQWACDNLVQGFGQTFEITWNAPTPGFHNVTFEVVYQSPIDGDGIDGQIYEDYITVINSGPGVTSPLAGVALSTEYVTDESGTIVTSRHLDGAETDDGTTTRQVSDLSGCCSMTALASATTSSTAGPTWQSAAARAKAQIDVVNGPYPGEGTFINDSYDSVARSVYTIPWRIESTTADPGTPVPVHIRTLLDGVLSFDFITRDLENAWVWQEGDMITPGTWEGTIPHATVGISIRVSSKRVSTGARTNVFELDATLNTESGLSVDNPAYLTFFTDQSFIGTLFSFEPAALRYFANIDQVRTEAWFEEFLFYVDEVYEVTTEITATSSLGRQYTWYTTWGGDFKLISDFYDTASYSLESPDPSVTFVALDAEASDPGVTDSDGDGVPDDQDICPGGDDNVNSDNDLAPDYCDVCPFDADNDADGDGVCGDVDVCPGGDDTVNTDGDTLPDACDVCPLDSENDIDGDGVCGDIDNCPLEVNSNQLDTDFDLAGNVCDFDDDGDGVCDTATADASCTAGPDNCTLIFNPDQSDLDGDGSGDACDDDSDNDGIIDAIDSCPFTLTGEVVDGDGCAVSDLCPCEGGWKNHGAYVRCVAHTSEDFLAAALITEAEKDAIVSSAAQSSCGSRE